MTTILILMIGSFLSGAIFSAFVAYNKGFRDGDDRGYDRGFVRGEYAYKQKLRIAIRRHRFEKAKLNYNGYAPHMKEKAV